MQKPVGLSMCKLRRWARFLKLYPEVLIDFPKDGDMDKIVLYTDASWGGHSSGKSTSSYFI
eukprot:311900-Alexandrium_andersonii.AAC.1